MKTIKRKPRCSTYLLITTALNNFTLPHVWEDSVYCIPKCMRVLWVVY